MKKLMHILIFLIFATGLAAQETYVIDSVCVGANRVYRVDGEKGYTYEWYVKDTLGNEIAQPANSDFEIINSPGDTTRGGQINYIWNDIGIFEMSTLVYTEHDCDTVEQGRILVYEPPGAEAGEDILVCVNQPAVLNTDTAWNYSSFIWTSSNGDGNFLDQYALHPTYVPGAMDSARGEVTLILTAFGKAMNITCDPAVDSMKVQFSNPTLALVGFDLLCFNDSSGWIKPTVSGGIEPYSFSWIGPGAFTSTTDSIYNLAAGVYYLTVTDNIGCSVSDTIEIIQPEELLASISVDVSEICGYDSIHANGNPVGGTGAFVHLWTGDGSVYLSALDVTDPFFKGAPEGTYELIYTVTDENGCIARDSINVTVWPPNRDTIQFSVCANALPFIWNGIIADVAGFYTDTITGTIGCDTVRTMELYIEPLFRDTVPLSVCTNELPYNWNGIPVSAEGFYIDTIPGTIGCDTILTLDLTINPLDTIIIDTALCENSPFFVWNSHTIQTISDSSYTSILNNIWGCDSTITLNVTIIPATFNVIDTLLTQGSPSFVWHGFTIITDMDSTYQDTLVNAAGCDSILTVNVDVEPADLIEIDTAVCDESAPFVWNGHDVITTVDSSYTYTTTNILGIDSIVVLNVEIIEVEPVTIDTLLCEGTGTFTWNGHTILTDRDSTYNSTLTSSLDCDSVLTLNVTILPASLTVLDTLITQGSAPFVWNGQTILTDRDSIYEYRTTNIHGCDSIVTIVVNVEPENYIEVDTMICEDSAPFVWNGHDIITTVDSSYSYTTTNIIGLDSTIVLNVDIIELNPVTIDSTLCAGTGTFTWNGQTIYTDVDSTYTATLTNSLGCDSVLTLNITVLPTSVTILDTLVVEGTPLI